MIYVVQAKTIQDKIILIGAYETEGIASTSMKNSQRFHPTWTYRIIKFYPQDSSDDIPFIGGKK